MAIRTTDFCLYEGALHQLPRVDRCGFRLYAVPAQ
jgi:hypothetical protein